MRSLASLILSVALAFSAAAQNPRDAVVVSTSWLAQHLRDPNLVLLHVGDTAEYRARHIPGARYIGLSDISVSNGSTGGLSLELPPVDTLRARLAALGIGDDSRIVVYYGKDRVTPTTRIIFTLDYAGFGKATSLLNGGMEAWVRDGHSVTSALYGNLKSPGPLSPLRARSIVVDADYVRTHLGKPGWSIVDARAPEFYEGTQTGGGRGTPHQTGHIAGARNVPFTTVTDSSFMLRPVNELAALFTKAGVQPGDTVITYCHIGQQATAVLFAARSLGFPVLLYDGSFEDWSRHTGFPVQTGKP